MEKTVMDWTLLFGTLVGWLTGSESGWLWSLVKSLLLGLSVSFAAALTLGCNAPTNTPTVTVSQPITATTDSAYPAPSPAADSSRLASANGWETSQPDLLHSRLPLIFSLSPIDWIVFTALSGSSGGLAGGAIAVRTALRRSKSNGT